MRTVINKHVVNQPKCLQPAAIDRSGKKTAARAESLLRESADVTRVPSQGRHLQDLESLKIQNVQRQVVAKVHDIKDLMEKLRADVQAYKLRHIFYGMHTVPVCYLFVMGVNLFRKS
jgi:hypothetical protein